MGDIAVRCRKCRKVTHWLTNFKKTWACPACGHGANIPVHDGREVIYEDDFYTLWRTQCGHSEKTSPWEPAVDSCRECAVSGWYKYRDLDAIVPERRGTADCESVAYLKVINSLLDRLVEDK